LCAASKFVASNYQHTHPVHYNYGPVTIIYDTCTFDGLVGTSSHTGGFLFQPYSNYYGQELRVINCKITNITVNGNNYGIYSGLFYILGPSQSWFQFEVWEMYNICYLCGLYFGVFLLFFVCLLLLLF
jgi:hypothetical protein